MENVISLSEIVGVLQSERLQICAKADVAYDQVKGRVFVALDCFARPFSPHAEDSRLRATWLPAPEHVTGDLPRDVAVDFGRSVFREWLAKVRTSMPAERSAA